MKEWHYTPMPSIDKSLSQQLTVFPREKDITISLSRGFWNLFLRCFLKFYFRLQIIGSKNLPSNKSYVIVANHSSHLDAVCLLSALPFRLVNRAFAVAAKDYFFRSFFRSLFSVISVNALPFDRTKQSKQSLEMCADVLNAADQILIMFPEGTRSADGQIKDFKPGIGLLVAGTERLVVPAYIGGAFAAWPKGHVFPKPKKVSVVIGNALNFEGRDKNGESYRAIAKEIEEAVRHLEERSRNRD